ncbi:hypothetical protein L3X38_023317 [Prunus dulcis]|uniref:Uncharacterized protein n=1 Tax=Prunus dulcis TaxID=3755 RepID=A0AAD4Z4D7_PRUDU|nr:hypothetical protein L3X38_023317 [Prunus dulcis]
MGVSREGLLISYPNRVQGKTCLKEFSSRRVREDMPQRSATGISNKWCEILSTTYEARLIYFLTQKLNYGPLGIGGSEKEKPQALGSRRSAQAHWGPEGTHPISIVCSRERDLKFFFNQGSVQPSIKNL